MKPDLELREFIATKLMGRTKKSVRIRGSTNVVTGWFGNPAFGDGVWDESELQAHAGLPEYELEIGPAFQAVEAMRARGYRPLINTAMDGAKWYVEMPHRDLRNTSSGTVNEHLPTAIALAIRAALESENQ